MLEVDIHRQLPGFDLQPRFEAADELVVLFGPSGSGKSLTLKAVAGLLTPQAGRIVLPDGTVAFDAQARIDLPPQQRRVGYVVQELALFPHLSARANVEFGIARWPKARRRQSVERLLALLGLEGLADRRPAQLSGGQQQRVALARALAPEPSLLLLDEPFSALDPPLRWTLRREISALRARLGLTVLLVTHDLNEAHALADRIVVYDEGRVLQQGSRAEVFRRPVSRRVAELGEMRNILPGDVVAYAEGVAVVRTPWCTARVRGPDVPLRGRVWLCIRPEHILVLRAGRDARDPGDAVLETEIVEEVAMGNTHRIFMRAHAIDADLGEPYVFEVDVPAHPYEVLGIPSRRDWRIVLTSEHLALVPRA
ncbi:MAG: ABC transporter ATP-binding protein [Dehalococcoidia bacterium]